MLSGAVRMTQRWDEMGIASEEKSLPGAGSHYSLNPCRNGSASSIRNTLSPVM